jgi:hypothetical protein
VQALLEAKADVNCVALVRPLYYSLTCNCLASFGSVTQRRSQVHRELAKHAVGLVFGAQGVMTTLASADVRVLVLCVRTARRPS